jgi:O-antigen ligase
MRHGAPQHQDQLHPPPLSSYCALALGLFLVLTMLKWGTAVVLSGEDTSMRALGFSSEAPADFWQAIYDVWPLQWASWAVIPVAFLGIASILSLKTTRLESGVPRSTESKAARVLLKLALVLPAVWLGWNVIAAMGTVSSRLTSTVLFQFSVCAAMFYLGLRAIHFESNRRLLFICLALGLVAVMSKAISQHFVEFEATRAMVRQMPDWQKLPPLFLKKLESNRVFGTMGGYPNALAGLILLLLPLTVTFLWRAGAQLSRIARALLVALPSAMALGSLYWSGSKAGCLLAAAMGLTALALSPLSKRWKMLLGTVVLIAGLVVFGIKFSEKGVGSTVARMEYWKAAVRIAAQHPFVGTGPGTYGVEFQKIKPIEAEMARVCHNDYLEQACDSGIPGFLIYATMVGAALTAIFLGARRRANPLLWALWLGLAGVFIHSFTEFHLYIPALGWPAFLLLGIGLAESRKTGATDTI